jgi:hypothetical protein
MFVGHMFVGVLTDTFNGITKIPAGLRSALNVFGRMIGNPIGLGILAGIAAAGTANAIADLIAGKLDETFNTTRFSEGRRDQKAHGTGLFDMVQRVIDGLIGGQAMGTAGAPRGWSWVGERGPELVQFRGGEQVLNSRASMAAAGGGSTVVNVSVNAPVGADGARTGAEIASYLDRFFARGGRLRYMPATR